MKIIEQFTQGKTGREEQNEDAFIVTDDFIAVLDGVTAKTCPPVGGKTGGRFAVEAALEAIPRLPREATARQAVDFLTAALARAVAGKISLPPEAEHPAFAVILYSRHRREVWRVADPLLMLDGVVHLNDIPLDAITSEARAFVIEAALKKGAALEDIAKQDVGRAFIAPMLESQHLFINKPGPYGFGGVNGGSVPDAFIQVFDVRDVREIVFASDGYPKLFPTLKESEAYLAGVLKEDPLLFRRHKSTKGMQPGFVSFDDRTYVRFLA